MPGVLKSNHSFTLRALCWSIRWSGLCYVLRRILWRNRTAILTYHDPKPAVMDAHLAYLKRVAKVISMPEFFESRDCGPSAVVTIDDGSIGNLNLAEIFLEHEVRPTLYICTGSIRVGGGLWWHAIEAQETIEEFKKLDNPTRKSLLRDLGFDEATQVTPRQVLPLEQLRSVLNWADLGAHTRFHPILTRCNDLESQEEISVSRKELLSDIGIMLEDFAYPNGDYSDRDVAYVRGAGFRSARTCDPGWNSQKSDRFRLKTIMIDDNGSVDKLAIQLTGVPGLGRKLLGHLVGSPQSAPSP
jgi:peptidoglycan/xylan/chitin deacetylase (PgdA/CDA1 family)